MQIIEVKFMQDALSIKYAHDEESTNEVMMRRDLLVKYVNQPEAVQALAAAIAGIVEYAEEEIVGDDADEDMRVQ